MDIPVTMASWSLAFFPLAVLLILMLVAKWGAAEAGPVSWLVAVLMAVFFFEAPLEVIGFESVKGTWSAVTVLFVVWASIMIYEVTDEGGAFDPLRRGIMKVMPDRMLQVLAFGWAFASFLQGVTGFGVPIAVCAPLLVGIGVRPLYAVIIPLIGHAWNNTFGTLAVAWLGLKQVTGLDADPLLAMETAIYASTFTWVLNALGGFLVCWLFAGFRGIRHGLPVIIVMSGIQGGLTLWLSQWNDTLNGFIAASVAFIAIFFMAYLPMYRKGQAPASKIFAEGFDKDDEAESPAGSSARNSADKAQSAGRMSMMMAFTPYIVLLLITFGVLLIAPLKELLGQFSFGLSFPETVTGQGFYRDATEANIAPFTHAGTFLLLSALIAYTVFKSRGYIAAGGMKRVLGNTVDKAIPSTIAVISLIAMSNVMAGVGSIDVLAHGVAAATGSGYGFLAPLVGGLGSFMTTSALASNLLFGTFQNSTAIATGISQAATLGAQTTGAAAGNMIAPGNVLLGTTTAGIIGKEGDVLKVTMPLFLAVMFIIGVICFAVS